MPRRGSIYVPPAGGKGLVLAQQVRVGRGSSTGRHLAYLQREGVGEDGGHGRLFTADDRSIDPEAFRYQASHDLEQYRLVVSPWSRGEHMQAFTRDLMERAQQDLGREVDWLAASHHNTAHTHAHVVIRGTDLEGRALHLDARYLHHGLQDRAREVEQDHQFDREYGQMVQREAQRLHRFEAMGPRDERYQAELRERRREIRAELQEMRAYEREEAVSPGRQRALELIARVQRDREEKGMGWER